MNTPAALHAHYTAAATVGQVAESLGFDARLGRTLYCGCRVVGVSALDTACQTLSFAVVALVVLLAPWFFGAWEMWWFWPFAVAISTAVALQAARLIAWACRGPETTTPTLAPAARQLLLAYFPFLIYGLVRALQAGVPMDAERSYLLHLTPFLLGAVVVFGLSARQRGILLALLLGNFCALAAYGIINHYATGNARVLWVPGFPHYQEHYRRATGSYFCPDHFAGLLELALALGLGLGLARDTACGWRVPALLLVPLALWGIALSKSRGGGLVVLGMVAATLWWGLQQWPRRERGMWRAVGAALVATAVLAVALRGGAYVRRFQDYPWRQIAASDRYQMAAAALRAVEAVEVQISLPVQGVGSAAEAAAWAGGVAPISSDRMMSAESKPCTMRLSWRSTALRRKR